MEKTGILLINLGTPESPEPKDVGKYLSEFLSDPFVIDLPAPLRFLLVKVLIVPRRKHASSALYKKIWTDEGSPLLKHHLALGKKVQTLVGDQAMVETAMRYGKPSLRAAIHSLKEKGATRIVACPLYPQYSLSATESSIDAVKKQAQAEQFKGTIDFVPAFYDKSAYLNAVAKVSAPYLKGVEYDKVLFSFHGLPERHVKKTDPSRSHCLNQPNCCAQISKINADCYRAQCFATAKAVAERLSIASEKYEVAFQSRLTDRWIKPFTDEYYRRWPAQGIKRIVVLSLSFVADCLETLEEIAIRGQEEFLSNGGEFLKMVPSLNSEEVWAEAVVNLLLLEKKERRDEKTHSPSVTV